MNEYVTTNGSQTTDKFVFPIDETIKRKRTPTKPRERQREREKAREGSREQQHKSKANANIYNRKKLHRTIVN